MLTNVMATATKRVMALATTWWVMKWAMVRAPWAIVTYAIAAIAAILASAVVEVIFIAAATTTVAQCCCPQCSHCSSCHHHPPLQHRNQMAMAWAIATEAIAMATRVVGEQWQQW
jgi:hypothetical protein